MNRHSEAAIRKDRVYSHRRSSLSSYAKFTLMPSNEVLAGSKSGASVAAMAQLALGMPPQIEGKRKFLSL